MGPHVMGGYWLGRRTVWCGRKRQYRNLEGLCGSGQKEGQLQGKEKKKKEVHT